VSLDQLVRLFIFYISALSKPQAECLSFFSGDGRCKTGETHVATISEYCLSPSFPSIKYYCCPSPATLYDCVWRGTPVDCADAKCKSDEVALKSDRFGGGSFFGCFCKYSEARDR